MAKSYWHRFDRQRISRRKLLAATGASAAGLAVVAACSDDNGGSGGATPGATEGVDQGTPKPGGRFLNGTDVNIDSLDPHISVAGGPTWFPSLYNVLVKQSSQDPTYFFMDLAEEYEQPEEDGTDWIFHIRPGVKIAPNSLGVPERDLDSEDAMVSFDRIKGLPEANACAFVCNWLDSSEAPDPSTFIWRTPGPYAWYLLNIGGTIFTSTIPPRELINDNPDRMRSAAVGGGPFVVNEGSYTEGERLIMDANPNYYRKDENNNNATLPYMAGWDVSIIPDRAARRAAFISQQSHTYGPENVDEANQLTNQYDVYQGGQDAVNTFISFTMNVTKPPWDNPDVRKAAMYALNRQQYIDIVYRGDARPNGLVNWGTGAFALPEEELDELQPFDPEMSKALIRGAGHDVPLRVKVMFPGNSTIEEHDQHLPIWLEQMRAAGFEIEQEAQDFNTWLDNYTNKNYDASLALNQVYETPEIPLDFQHSAGPAGSDIYSNGLQDPAIDAAIEATKEITNPDELVDAIHDVQRQIYEAGPMFLPIVSPFSRTLYWNFVKNLPMGLGTAAQLLRPYMWLDQ